MQIIAPIENPKSKIYTYSQLYKLQTMFNKEIYSNRRSILRQKIGSGLILIPGNQESPMNYHDNTYHFRQDSTFLYFFGLDLPGMFGVIDVDNNRDWIYANDIDIEDIIWMGPQKSVADQAAMVGVEATAPLAKLNQAIEQAINSSRRIHFIPPYRAENQAQLSSLLGIKTCKINHYASLALIHACVEMRSTKDTAEIAEIERAWTIGYEMHLTAMKMAQPGIVEQQIAGFIEGIALSKGAGTSFPTILTQNGETLHNHNHSFTLEAGRLMLVDAGAESNGHYASDFTRTIPVGGKFSQQQLDIYNIVLAANNKTFSLTKPGCNLPIDPFAGFCRDRYRTERAWSDERRCGRSCCQRGTCALFPARSGPHDGPRCTRHGRLWTGLRRI